MATIWNVYGQTTTVGYDALGRETLRVLPTGLREDRTFDAAGREILLTATKPDGTMLSGYTASYDAVGNRLSVLELDGARVTYGYDAVYRLLSEERSRSNASQYTLQYDAVGQRVVKLVGAARTTMEYDAADQLTRLLPTTGAPTTCSFDALGNLHTEWTGAQGTTYTWDTANRLTHIDLPDGTHEDNRYRTDGLRDWHYGPTGETYYTWDEGQVLLEKASSFVPQAIYTVAPPDGEAASPGGVISYKRGADHLYLVPDLQGHSRQRTTSTGTVESLMICDAWGSEVYGIGGAYLYLRAFGQHGYWRDTASRLYVEHRHLRTDTGLWLSVDPVEGEPAYLYVGDRPTWAVDPSGELPDLRQLLNGPAGPALRGAADWAAGVSSAVGAALANAETSFVARVRRMITPEAIANDLHFVRTNPVLGPVLANLPSADMAARTVEVTMRLAPLAAATCGRIEAALPKAFAKSLPKDEKQRERWKATFAKGFAIGMASQAVYEFTPAGAMQFAEALCEDVSFFREAGLSAEVIWTHYVDEPALQLLGGMAESADVAPELFGSILGSITLLLLLRLLEALIEAAATAEAGGAGALLAIARTPPALVRLAKVVRVAREGSSVTRLAQRLIRIPAVVSWANRIAGRIGGFLPGKNPFGRARQSLLEMQRRLRKLMGEARLRRGLHRYGRTHAEMTELFKDPDDGLKISRKSAREVGPILALEDAGSIPGPVRRPSGPGLGDFIDANGVPVDVKGFVSLDPTTLRPLARRQGGFDRRTAEMSIDRMLTHANGPRNVVLDFSELSAEHQAVLDRLVASRPDWRGRVFRYP